MTKYPPSSRSVGQYLCSGSSREFRYNKALNQYNVCMYSNNTEEKYLHCAPLNWACWSSMFLLDSSQWTYSFVFPLRHTWPVLTPFIHIIRNTRFRGFSCSWIKVESQKDSMGTDSWYIEGLVLSGGWSVLHCKEFVQCQSVKAASKPTVTHFGKGPGSDKSIGFLWNQVKMPACRSRNAFVFPLTLHRRYHCCF